MSYLGYSLRKSNHSAKMQSVYSTAPTDWANYQKRFSFSLKVSLFYPYPIFLVWGFPLSLETSVQLSFFPFLFPFFSVLLMLVFVFLVVFLCNLLVVISMHQRYLDGWRVLFLLLFLTLTVCLRHLSDVRPYTSSWVFLLPCPFVEVLLWSSLRMVSSILQGWMPIYLSL